MNKSYNGMHLSTLEGIGTISQNGISKLFQTQKSFIPHYSKLQDKEIRIAIFDTGIAYNFSDKNGNLFVVGNASVKDYDNNKPLPFLQMLNKGLYNKEWIISNIPRSTGNGAIERDADFILKAYKVNRGASETAKKLFNELNINPNELGWYEFMQVIEKTGKKFKNPFVFVRSEVEVISIGKALKYLESQLPTIIAILAVVGSAFGIPPQTTMMVANGLKALLSASKPNASINDILKGAGAIASVVAPSLDLEQIKKGITDKIPKEYIEYAEKGVKIYDSINKKNLGNLLGLHGLNGLSSSLSESEFDKYLNIGADLVKAYNTNDVKKVMEVAGIDLKEAEAITRAYQTLNTSKGLESAFTNNNPLNTDNNTNQHINNFIQTTYSSLLQRDGSNLGSLNAGFPNNIEAVMNIAGNMELKNEEFKTLTNSIQGLPANAKDMKEIAVLSIVNQAKEFENSTYVLPNSMPPSVQIEAGMMIKKLYRNVSVEAVNSQVNLAINNWKEYVSCI